MQKYVKYIIDNNPDLDLFVFQLTHPARTMMGVSMIKSDEMGELLSAIETKKAFGDFDEELGKK